MGDLAVVAEAVETCLPSPWKPLAARPGRGLGGEVRRAAGLSLQLPPVVRARRFQRRRSSERARLTLSPAPRHPEAQAPTLPWLPARSQVSVRTEPHLLQKETRRSPTFTTEPERRKDRGGAGSPWQASGGGAARAPL